MFFNSKDIIGVPTSLGLGASPSYIASNIFNDAFSVYGLYDWLGTGGNVVRMYNSSASPTERDFTEAQLSDGTYSTWAGSGTSKISKFYDLKGVSDHDIFASSSANQMQYYASDNEFFMNASGYYQYTTMQSTACDTIENAFADNQPANHTTMVMSARKTGTGLQDLPVSGRSFIGMRDAISPSNLEQVHHKAIGIRSAMYSSELELSAKGDDFVDVNKLGTPAVNLGTTLNTYAGGMYRTSAVGTVTTDFDLFVDGVHSINESTTSLDAEVNIRKFQIGNNKLRSQGFAFFNKQLTQAEHTKVHNAFSAKY